MPPLSTSPQTLTVFVRQSEIDRVIKARGERKDKESRLEQEIPEFEEKSPSRGIGPVLLVGAIVTSLLAFSSLQVAESHAPATLSNASVSSGIQTMSAAELIQSVKSQNLSAFWLASVPGDSYSISTATDGVDQISYFPEGSTFSNVNQSPLSVTTYKDLATYNSNTHLLLGANSRTDVLSNGTIVTYDSTAATQSFVSFPGSPQKVEISYSSIQPIPSILNDAENLVPVK